MRLSKLSIRDMGPFASLDLDLGELPEEARVVAVTGPNGAGKSTLLELWTGGALYRECPTRGSLASLATSRASSLAVEVSGSATWQLRHTVDAQSGKGESVPLDACGAALTSAGRVREYDGWARRHLPPPEVLYASTVGTQRGRTFLELLPGERKAVLLRALGVERLEALAGGARERAAVAQRQAEVLRARIADELERGGDLEAAQGAALACESALAEAKVVVSDETQCHVSALAAAAVREVAAERAAEWEAARRGLETRAETQRAALRGVEERAVNNRRLLEGADGIREAEREVEQLCATEPELVEALSRATAAASETREEVAARGAETRAARAALEALEQRLAAMKMPVVRVVSPEVLEAAEREVETWRERLDAHERDLEEVRGMTVAGADARVESLRSGHREVLEHATIATCRAAASEALTRDDAAAEAARAYPARLEQARVDAQLVRRGLAEAEARLVEWRQAAADMARADELGRAREALLAERDAARLARDTAEQAEAAARVASGERAATVGQAEAALAVCRERLAAARRIAQRAVALASAEARLVELETARDVAAQALAGVEAELAALGPAPSVPPPVDVAQAQRAREHAEAREAEARTALARADEARRIAFESAGRRAAMQHDLDGAQAEASEWARLARDLGRDGLQALLIDQAGPELEAIANDLLGQVSGGRWSLSIQTQRASADGKKTLEGCEVMVEDHDQGGDPRPGSTLSGGESVLVAEALALALATLACRVAGLERPTLVRDESGAALDPARGREYVAMLRRAAEMAGADRVLVVSHQPDVVDLCDARIVVADGTARVAA